MPLPPEIHRTRASTSAPRTRISPRRSSLNGLPVQPRTYGREDILCSTYGQGYSSRQVTFQYGLQCPPGYIRPPPKWTRLQFRENGWPVASPRSGTGNIIETHEFGQELLDLDEDLKAKMYGIWGERPPSRNTPETRDQGHGPKPSRRRTRGIRLPRR
ncbi:hypothetical protein VTK56DRAFT_8443 [Thermocarpiscus australiensis]